MKYRTDRASLERESSAQYYRSGGPGGQHRNKTETAVRLVHGPSGLVVIAAESRSRARNVETAFGRLAARLEALNRTAKKRIPTKVPGRTREKRLMEKRTRSEKKERRRPPEW